MFCNAKDWFIFEKIIGLFVFFCANAQFEWMQAAKCKCQTAGNRERSKGR